MAVTSTFAETASRVILGPLLTTYTAPSICTNYGVVTGHPGGFEAQGCSNGILGDIASCWPTVMVPTPTPPYHGWGFYSPGTVCPGGYTSACASGFANDVSSAASTLLSNFDFQFPLIPGESAVGCCPNGFTCTGGLATRAQTCVSVITSGSYLVGTCPITPIAPAVDAESLSNFQYIYIPGTETITAASDTTKISRATFTSVVLFAPLFQINWQATDRPITSSLTSTSSFSGTTSRAFTTLLDPTISPTSTSSASLPTGAKIAIGITVPVAVLALVLILGLFWLRRRRYRTGPTQSPLTASVQEQREPKPPLHTVVHSELDAATLRPELQSSQPKLAGPSQQELESPAAELAGYRGYRPPPHDLHG